MTSRRMLGWAVAAAGALVAGAAFLWSMEVGVAAQTEEPEHEVLSRHEGFEVRRYAPRIEAQVTLPGTYEQAIQGGFRVLAGYIFGGNQPGARIAMTTPVSATAGTRIDMTAPVSATAGGQGWVVSFTMPAHWTLQTLPVPNDDRIKLVQVPEERWAVRTFSGRARQAQNDAETAALLAAVRREGLEATGPAVVAQYNPPWILGPWRRNEIWVPIGS